MLENQQVTPYDNPEESKKGQVTKMFDKIAPYYDQLNRVLSLGIDVLWRKRAIKMLKVENPKTILDIATGTGDLALEAARVIRPDHITGTDISEKMLEIGRKKIEKRGLSGMISMEIGDSEHLKYADHSYDAVMVAFGVRNFENLEKGLSEMFRVLKPNGTVIILEFSKPRVFPLNILFNLYFKYILPVIGKLRSKDEKAYKYLYESVQAFPDYERFTSILEKLGYRHINYKALSGGICCIYQAKK